MTDSTTATQSVIVERDFPHPPDRLWRALTQPALIADWLMKNDFVPTVGHKFHLSGEWGGTLDCEVLEVEPGETLSYTFDFRNEDPGLDVRTVVTFTLAPTATGTHLRVEQAGFRPDQPRALGGAKFGWQQNFDKLETVLGAMS